MGQEEKGQGALGGRISYQRIQAPLNLVGEERGKEKLVFVCCL